MSAAPRKRPWRKWFLINSRADWLALVMADKSLGNPAKITAFALSYEFDKHTMCAQATRETLGDIAGCEPKTISNGRKQLEARGYLAVTDDGIHANIYQALRFDEYEAKNGTTRKAKNGTTKSARNLPHDDSPKTGSLSDGLSDFQCALNRPPVGKVSAGCDADFGHLSAQKRDALYRYQDSVGGALERAPPSTGANSSPDSWNPSASSSRLLGADDAPEFDPDDDWEIIDPDEDDAPDIRTPVEDFDDEDVPF